MVSYWRGERKVDFLTHQMQHRMVSSPARDAQKPPAGLQVLLEVSSFNMSGSSTAGFGGTDHGDYRRADPRPPAGAASRREVRGRRASAHGLRAGPGGHG